MKDKTDHNQAILQILSCIPLGKVCTYGNIAHRAGQPGGARYVGYILRSLPADSSIPWHRVINSQGRSAFPSGSCHQQQQLSLLKKEGIEIVNEKISLKQYLWQ